jgi:hypothetical protein
MRVVKEDFKNTIGSGKEHPLTMQTQVEVYNQPILSDKASIALLSTHSIGEVLEKHKVIETEKNYIDSIPLDKVYCHFESPFPVKIVEKFKDESKSMKLYTQKRKLFFTSRKTTLVMKVGKAQITIWGNYKSSEIQFNGKETSYEFINSLFNMIYPGELARLARLDISFDVKRSLEYITRNIIFLNKRSRRTFSMRPPKISVDSKKGIVFEYAPTAEYHGKNKEITIYDSGKKHKLGKDISRIEIRYKVMKVVPVRNFQDLELLKLKSMLFSDIRLPLRIDSSCLSKTERKHFQKLKRIALIRNCSPSLALSELRSKDRSCADSAARALKKSEKDHFNFHESFKSNLDIFLNSKMTSGEREFLTEIQIALKDSSGST